MECSKNVPETLKVGMWMCFFRNFGYWTRPGVVTKKSSTLKNLINRQYSPRPFQKIFFLWIGQVWKKLRLLKVVDFWKFFVFRLINPSKLRYPLLALDKIQWAVTVTTTILPLFIINWRNASLPACDSVPDCHNRKLSSGQIGAPPVFLFYL